MTVAPFYTDEYIGYIRETGLGMRATLGRFNEAVAPSTDKPVWDINSGDAVNDLKTVTNHLCEKCRLNGVTRVCLTPIPVGKTLHDTDLMVAECEELNHGTDFQFMVYRPKEERDEKTEL